jgi:hypothetical protein
MTMQQRSYDLPDLIVNLQNNTVQALPATSPTFAGAVESISVLSSVSILSNAGPPYYCGTGALGTSTIWCGYWVAD